MNVTLDHDENGMPMFTTDDGAYRTRLERMEYPDRPDGDVFAPTFYVEDGWMADSLPSVYVDTDVTESVMRRAFRHFGNDERMISRYLGMFYGVRGVETVGDHRGEYWILDTPGWRKHVGISDDVTDVLKSEREVWQAYHDGDVFGIITEMMMISTVTRRNVRESISSAPVTETEWVEHESVWGFYGEKYATEEAKMMAEEMDK